MLMVAGFVRSARKSKPLSRNNYRNSNLNILLLYLTMVKKRYHAIVTGLVQGVFFRMFAKRTARSLGLKGYTKNLPDKTVEVVVEGEEKNIKVILDWLKKGPSAAKVVDIKIKKQEYKGEFDIMAGQDFQECQKTVRIFHPTDGALPKT